MYRLVMKTILRIGGEAALITVVGGVLVATIGALNRWDNPVAYSNAFFIAGGLAIIAGASSRLGASQEWNTFLVMSAESFRDMGASQRANFIVQVSSSFRLVIVGLLGGMGLILISAFFASCSTWALC